MNTKIKELKPHMENVTIVARVISKTQIAEIRGKEYASAIVEDDTGEIKLNLWRSQVGQFEAGDVIKIPGAFVHVRDGAKQISTWWDIEKQKPGS